MLFFQVHALKKHQVAPSKLLFRVHIKGALDIVLKLDLAQIKHYKIVCFQKALLHNQSYNLHPIFSFEKMGHTVILEYFNIKE